MSLQPDRFPKFLTVDEVKDILRVSDNSIYRVIETGELIAVKIGGTYRIEEDEVSRYIASHRTREVCSKPPSSLS